MNKILVSFVVVILTVYQSGCATIVSGSEQDISIRSNPAGAMVLLDGMQLGTTPLMTDLKRKKRHTIKIQKDGYLEETRSTKRGFNWWYVGNVLFGGIIGLIVDPCTGAMYKIDPDEINATLVPQEGSLTADIKSNSVEATVAKSELSVDQQVAQIEAMADLKDRGLLTEEEYIAKKKEILQ